MESSRVELRIPLLQFLIQGNRLLNGGWLRLRLEGGVQPTLRPLGNLFGRGGFFLGLLDLLVEPPSPFFLGAGAANPAIRTPVLLLGDATIHSNHSRNRSSSTTVFMLLVEEYCAPQTPADFRFITMPPTPTRELN